MCLRHFKSRISLNWVKYPWYLLTCIDPIVGWYLIAKAENCIWQKSLHSWQLMFWVCIGKFCVYSAPFKCIVHCITFILHCIWCIIHFSLYTLDFGIVIKRCRGCKVMLTVYTVNNSSSGIKRKIFWLFISSLPSCFFLVTSKITNIQV